MIRIAKRGALGALAALALGVTLGGAAPASAQEDRHVRVVNETRSTMREFYASNINRDSWEEDILGQDQLAPGQSVTINIDDKSGMCLFDFKAVFSDGATLVRNRINVCTTRVYRYTED